MNRESASEILIKENIVLKCKLPCNMDSQDKLKKLFSDFPTVGKRTADRFVYYLIKLPKEKVDELILAIQELKSKIKLCQKCFNPFDHEGSLCLICQSSQ